MLKPHLNIGTVVNIYDDEWTQSEVKSLYDTSNGAAIWVVHRDDNLYLATSWICWSDTRERYEYVRSGTPVYP